jgi:hypothetical protein
MEDNLMAGPTVPISEYSYQLLQQLAQRTGQTTMDLLDEALETYRRKLLLDQMNAGYAALRADPQAWAEHQAERQLWDATLLDGLESGELWTADGRCLNAENDQPEGGGEAIGG